MNSNPKSNQRMISPLKTCLAGFTAAALLSTAGAQTSSSTPVIGYYKVAVPNGTSALGIAFVTKTEFQGQGSVSGGVITQAGATWTNNQFQTSATPLTSSSHYVEILSGTNTGAIFDIISNNGTSITLATNIGAAPYSISGATTYCVRKHSTMADIFLTAGLDAYADTVTVIDHTNLEHIYGTDGAAIVDGGDFSTVKNNDVVYPGQGFLISASAKTLTFGGGAVSYVKTGPTKVYSYAGGVNLVTVMNPLAGNTAADTTTCGTLGLAASLSPFADLATIFSTDGLLTEQNLVGSDGTIPVDGGDFSTTRATLPVRNGAAVYVSVSANGFFNQPQTTP